MPTEVCCVCEESLEDKDILTVYLGLLPSEADDEDVEHEYWCDECYDADTISRVESHPPLSGQVSAGGAQGGGEWGDYFT